MRNKRYRIGLVMGSLILLTGCMAQNNSSESITDPEGDKVSVPREVNRIISTAPSNTEILVGLGLQDKIVAIDECSEDIEGIGEGTVILNLTNPDAEAIIGLEPDLIITSDINELGSASNPFAILEEMGIPVIYISTSESIEEIYKDIKCIAEATSTEDEGAEMIRTMQDKVKELSTIAEAIPKEKRVYFEISPAPYLYTGGAHTYLNEMIEIIGADNIFSDQEGWLSPSDEAIITENPDVILTNVTYIEDPISEILKRDGWNQIKAVQNKTVYSIDTNISSRPSQHIVEGLEAIAKAVYPEYYEDK